MGALKLGYTVYNSKQCYFFDLYIYRHTRCMCSGCRPTHDGYYLGNKHLGHAHVGQWSRQVIAIKQCTVHPGKTLEFHCSQHKAVCCSICLPVCHAKVI